MQQLTVMDKYLQWRELKIWLKNNNPDISAQENNKRNSNNKTQPNVIENSIQLKIKN